MIFDPKDANRIRAFALAVVGLIMTNKIWGKQDFFLTFDLWPLIVTGTFISYFLLCVFLDRYQYAESQKVKSFTPTFVGLGVVVLNIGCYFIG